jgi:hypothetical protein
MQKFANASWRGVDLMSQSQSDKEESKEMFGRTPYRKLPMQGKFTPPLKKPKQIVPDSDENSSSEYGNYDDDEPADDDDVLFRTPKRIDHTDGKVVQKWSTSTSLPEINRQIDALLARSLRSVGYVASHVTKTKETDWSFWKEAHVSALLNDALAHCVPSNKKTSEGIGGGHKEGTRGSEKSESRKNFGKKSEK